ncbi:hypothetical protein HPB49_017912 [Dermacentor silvarum]|uniref:Uncharacterized protein n=1 Tax=Dermacentor silvarum TaxID=543639 RepID=A0ACB8E1Z5_DERSI|nr:hypothetical protein HPB49_017912 [Dermacentor silvarum]
MAQNRKRRYNDADSSSFKRRRLDPRSLVGQIEVAVRVRWLNEREADAVSVVGLVDERCLLFDPKAEAEPFYIQGQQAHGGLLKHTRTKASCSPRSLTERKASRTCSSTPPRTC